jgi:hypothetical protein
MRDDEDTEPNAREPDDTERDDDQPDSGPTRGGSNVPNAGRDPKEDRTE